jgi:hypothetical protein
MKNNFSPRYRKKKICPGFVYVIGPKVGPLKIGVAISIEKRLASLQVGHPQRLRILGEWQHKRPYIVEEHAHRALAKERMCGEWFDVSLQEATEAVTVAVHKVKGYIEPFADPSPETSVELFCDEPDEGEYEHEPEISHSPVKAFQLTRSRRIEQIEGVLGFQLTRAQIQDMQQSGMIPLHMEEFA